MFNVPYSIWAKAMDLNGMGRRTAGKWTILNLKNTAADGWRKLTVIVRDFGGLLRFVSNRQIINHSIFNSNIHPVFPVTKKKLWHTINVFRGFSFHSISDDAFKIPKNNNNRKNGQVFKFSAKYRH
jgi:hypothetical protein